jgi:Uma2 family endonuclease
MTAALNDDSSARVAVLTVDDLESFPEDGLRRELIDGLLHVSPAPSRAHQKIASYLERALEETCPEHLETVQGVEIRLGPRRSFIPDVLVITADAAQHGLRVYEPREVVLAVEIVSPTSVAIDRVLKPNLYAEAGIPHFWRIEIEDGKILVNTYTLDSSGSYRETGQHSETIELVEPWKIDIPISRLMPRFF